MASRPEIAKMDHIWIGATLGIVVLVRPEDHPFGDCKVVCTPEKPTTSDVKWNGKGWAFKKGPDYGGYARQDTHGAAITKLRNATGWTGMEKKRDRKRTAR